MLNSNGQGKNKLMLSEVANPNGINMPSDYNSYSGSLGSAVIRRSAIPGQK